MKLYKLTLITGSDCGHVLAGRYDQVLGIFDSLEKVNFYKSNIDTKKILMFYELEVTEYNLNEFEEPIYDEDDYYDENDYSVRDFYKTVTIENPTIEDFKKLLG